MFDIFDLMVIALCDLSGDDIKVWSDGEDILSEQKNLQDINDTIEILEKVLAETDFDNDEIYYRASW